MNEAKSNPGKKSFAARSIGGLNPDGQTLACSCSCSDQATVGSAQAKPAPPGDGGGKSLQHELGPHGLFKETHSFKSDGRYDSVHRYHWPCRGIVLDVLTHLKGLVGDVVQPRSALHSHRYDPILFKQRDIPFGHSSISNSHSSMSRAINVKTEVFLTFACAISCCETRLANTRGFTSLC